MSESINKKSISGILWSGVEKMSYEAIQFVVGIILARLLTPHDYGAVGLLMVFVLFSQLFIDGGLSTALIQKKDRTENDYNTVFWYNLGMSFFLYCIIFLLSPIISDFYEMPELKAMLRVLALSLIISPFSSIQVTQLTINIDFKKISFASVPSAILSGIIGILMAYKGFGAYALVAQQVAMASFRCIILNIISNYKIKAYFSKKSFHDMFSFSYKLVLASSLDRIYTSVYTMVIGKVFCPSILGLYSRGEQFAKLPAGILGDIFNRVTLPVMSTVQDEPQKLETVFKKYIQGASTVIFAAFVCLIIIAKPLILILLTEKWIDVVPLLQILCLAYMTEHICTINRNLLYIKKRSDLALRLEIIKKTIAITIFLVSVMGGIYIVCCGLVLYSVIALYLNSYYTQKFIGLSILQQVSNFGYILIIAFAAAIIPFYLGRLFESNYIQIIIMMVSYIIMYCILHAIIKSYPYTFAMSELKKRIR